MSHVSLHYRVYLDDKDHYVEAKLDWNPAELTDGDRKFIEDFLALLNARVSQMLAEAADAK